MTRRRWAVVIGLGIMAWFSLLAYVLWLFTQPMSAAPARLMMPDLSHLVVVNEVLGSCANGIDIRLVLYDHPSSLGDNLLAARGFHLAKDGPKARPFIVQVWAKHDEDIGDDFVLYLDRDLDGFVDHVVRGPEDANTVDLGPPCEEARKVVSKRG